MTEKAAGSSPKTNAAIDDANRWRGAMANLYARGEMIVAERLRREMPGKPIPRMTLQRTSKLKEFFEGKPQLLGVIESFESELLRRNFFIHGNGIVTQNGRGWLLALEYDDGKSLRRDYVQEIECEALRARLSSVVSKMGAKLRA